MEDNWQENKRWHIFKSATGCFVLNDTDQSLDWTVWEKNISSFCLKLLAFGLNVDDVWICKNDFNQVQLKKIYENLIDNHQDANLSNEQPNYSI